MEKPGMKKKKQKGQMDKSIQENRENVEQQGQVLDNLYVISIKKSKASANETPQPLTTSLNSN